MVLRSRTADRAIPMDVYWLEQRLEDVPDEDYWLSSREIVFLNGLRFAKRRADWRLGRWTAKRALSSFLSPAALSRPLANIEVRKAASGAPETFWQGVSAPVTISLSHRNSRAICSVSGFAVELGCDLEMIELRSDAFVADYFTAEEQALVANRPVVDRATVLALLWSAKESALKALRSGLRLDTRCVVVDLPKMSFADTDWHPLKVAHTAGHVFCGWWQTTDRMVRTIVAAPAPEPPKLLEIGDSHYGPGDLLLRPGPLQTPNRPGALPIGR